MKIIRRFVLVFVFVLLFSFVCCSCQTTQHGTNQTVTTNSNIRKITLTKSNFKEYFNIEIRTDYVNVTKHGGEYVLGIWIPVYYTAKAAFTVCIYPKKTMKIDSVSVNLRLFDVAHYFDIDETVTINVPANGESYRKQFVTSPKDRFFDEHFFDNMIFSHSVESASGVIIIESY